MQKLKASLYEAFLNRWDLLRRWDGKPKKDYDPHYLELQNLYMCPSQSTHHTQSFYTWMPLWKEQKKSKGAHLHIEASAHSHYACEKSNIWPFVYEIRNDNRLFTTGGHQKIYPNPFLHLCAIVSFSSLLKKHEWIFGFRFDTMYSMKDVMWTEERTRLWFLVSRSPGEKADVERNRKRKPFHIWDWFTSDCLLLHSDDDDDDDI